MVDYRTFKIVMKGIIFLFWILTLSLGIVDVQIEMTSTLAEYYLNTVSYFAYGYNVSFYSGESLVLHPLYWLFVTLFFISLFLNLGYIKKNSDKYILRNLGYFSGIIMLISLLGLLIIPIGSTDINNPPFTGSISNLSRSYYMGVGFTWGIILVIVMFAEPIIQNYTNIIKKEVISKEVKLTKVPEMKGVIIFYCSSCGADVLDYTSDFCSKCGERLK